MKHLRIYAFLIFPLLLKVSGCSTTAGTYRSVSNNDGMSGLTPERVAYIRSGGKLRESSDPNIRRIGNLQNECFTGEGSGCHELTVACNDGNINACDAMSMAIYVRRGWSEFMLWTRKACALGSKDDCLIVQSGELKMHQDDRAGELCLTTESWCDELEARCKCTGGHGDTPVDSVDAGACRALAVAMLKKGRKNEARTLFLEACKTHYRDSCDVLNNL